MLLSSLQVIKIQTEITLRYSTWKTPESDKSRHIPATVDVRVSFHFTIYEMSTLFYKFNSIIPDKLPELCNALCALSLKYCKVRLSLSIKY